PLTLENVAQRAEAGFVDTVAQGAHDVRLEHAAQLVELHELQREDAADAEAALRQHLDQAFGFELAQCFASRGARDAEHRRDRVFGVEVIGSQLPVQKGEADGLVSLGCQRVGPRHRSYYTSVPVFRDYWPGRRRTLMAQQFVQLLVNGLITG